MLRQNGSDDIFPDLTDSAAHASQGVRIHILEVLAVTKHLALLIVVRAVPANPTAFAFWSWRVPR